MYQPRIADHIFMFKLSPQKLDKLLSMGYFRNANIMYQSQVICLDGILDDVVNVRIDLHQHTFPKSIRKIAAKAEKKFSYKIQKAEITDEKEKLYRQHRDRFKGFQFKSLEQLLFGDSPIRLFDTYEINVYDGEELIAYSFFDVGRRSIASILGVFHQDYSSYSLGLYTMYAEINWAKSKEFHYYYPGYILHNNELFNYKLRLGEHQFFNWQKNSWGPKEEIDFDKTIGNKILGKLYHLIELLQKVGIHFEYKLYPFYSLGYLSLTNYQFYVKSPVHILLPDISYENRKIIIEYDSEDDKYVIATVRYNETYRQLLADNQQINKTALAHEWSSVLEYVSVQKYIFAENLVHDLWKSSNSSLIKESL